MKTSSITKGAMCVAIYGLLLLLNQQTGLMIEASLSWVFIMPILLYSASQGVRAGLVTVISMGLLSFLFGSFTTWFYSWSALLIGYLYGVGVHQQFRHRTNFFLCFFFSTATYIAMVYLWAALFGLDLHADFDAIASWISFIDFQAFCALFVLFMGFLQALCVHLLAILLCNRLHIPIRDIGSLKQIHGNSTFGMISIIVWLLFFFGQNVLEYPIWQTGLQICFFADCMLLSFFGAVVLIDYGIRHNIRKFSFFAIIGAVIPVVNLIWIFLGELDCLFAIRKNWDLRG